MAETLAYYGHVITSLEPGLALLLGLLSAGKVLIFGGRMISRAMGR